MPIDPERTSDEEALTRAHATLRRVERGAVRVDAPAPLAGQAPASLAEEVLRIRQATAAPAGTILRRLLFVWFRVYVREARGSKVELTNVRIPVPIPLVGLLLPRRMDAAKAARLVDAMRRPPSDGDGGIEGGLASSMAFEFVRHATHDPDRDKSEFVVIGFD